MKDVSKKNVLQTFKMLFCMQFKKLILGLFNLLILELGLCCSPNVPKTVDVITHVPHDGFLFWQVKVFKT